MTHSFFVELNVYYNNIVFDYSYSNMSKVIKLILCKDFRQLSLILEGPWLNTSLEIEVSNFYELGYVCYIVGKTGLLRVTNCWNEKFNVRHNNILCVSTKDNRLLYDIDQMKLVGSVGATCTPKH